MKTKLTQYALPVILAALLTACGGGGGGGDSSSTVNPSQAGTTQTATVNSFKFKQAYSDFVSNSQTVTFNIVATQRGQTATGSATLSKTVSGGRFESKGALAVAQSLSLTLTGRTTVSVDLPEISTDYFDSGTFQYLGSVSSTDYTVSSVKDLPVSIADGDNIELFRETEYANSTKTTKTGDVAVRLTATRRDATSLTVRLTPEDIAANGSRSSSGYFEYVLSSTGTLTLVGFNIEDKDSGTVVNATVR